MPKIGPKTSLGICIALFFSLGACGTKTSHETKNASPKTDSLRTMAFETFAKMARLSCTYKITEAVSSAEIAESECESAVTKKKGNGQWKEEWKKALGAGLTNQQFDSLCLNLIKVSSGDMPLPVSAKIQENAKQLASLNEAALKDLLKLAD
jgi:hypothetical protein